METSPVTSHTLEIFYHINAHTCEKQYKETLSGFRGRPCRLIAVVSENIRSHLIIDEEKRMKVKEVPLDLSDSMRKIVSVAFPKAQRVIDRFHIQKPACDIQQMSLNFCERSET